MHNSRRFLSIERLLLIDELLSIYQQPGKIPRAIQETLKNTQTYPALYNFILNTKIEI